MKVGFLRGRIRHPAAADSRVKVSSARMVELDALRGIAAFSVLLYHFTSIYPRLIANRSFEIIPQLNFGYFGVELFFIISGYVIFFSVQKAKSLRDFALSRFARLYPTYWVSVCISFLILLVVYRTPPAALVPEAAINLTMLQTFAGASNLDGSYWTLALELSFYVWIALACALCVWAKKPIEMVLILWLGVATFIRASGVHVPYRLGVFGLLYYGQFFIFGICLYRIHSGSYSKWTILALVWAILESMFGAHESTPAAGFQHYFIGAWGVESIAAFAIFFRPKILSAYVLQFFGAISYSLYLTHSTIGFCILKLAGGKNEHELVAIALAIIVSVVTAFILNVTVEVPSRVALAKMLGLHRPNIQSRT